MKVLDGNIATKSMWRYENYTEIIVVFIMISVENYFPITYAIYLNSFKLEAKARHFASIWEDHIPIKRIYLIGIWGGQEYSLW